MLSSLKAHIWRFIHRQLTVPDLFLQYQISFFSHQVCVDLWRQVGKVCTWLHLLEWVNSLYTSRLWLRQRVEGSRVCPAECQLLDSRTSSQTPHCKTRITVSNQEEMQARCFPYETGKIYVTPCTRGASLVPQAVKNPPAMQETWVPGLGRSSWRKEWLPTRFLAWRIPWTEEPGGPQSVGLQRVGRDWATNTFTQKMETGQALGFEIVEVWQS